jgi:hypothetical protein
MANGRTKLLRKPLPTLTLRCEWCKQLFAWKPTCATQAMFFVRRTCSKYCRSRLRSWELEHSPSTTILL